MNCAALTSLPACGNRAVTGTNSVNRSAHQALHVLSCSSFNTVADSLEGSMPSSLVMARMVVSGAALWRKEPSQYKLT